MSVNSRRLRTVAAVALTASLAVSAAACSKKDSTPGGGATTASGPVTITLQYFGKPGFEGAVADFQKANPNITVKVSNQGELKDFSPKLAQWLSAGKGAGDVVMLEEGQLLGYVQDNKNFANLYDLGANDIKGDYLPFKITNASTPDGSKLIGLGTDVGPLAMCYRTDLFKKAGLPTDREEVGALWPTWEDYATKGKVFKSKVKDATWLDSATSIMQPYIMQNAETWFYDKEDNFIGDKNPVVKKAWDFGLQMAADGLTGKLGRWTTDWSTAFKKASFATLPCPPWMANVIKDNAGPAGKGKWDVAKIPGNGGNWGGSYLAIPEQSQHKAEAFKLAAYLTGPEGGVSAFKASGALPSNVKALEDSRVTEKTDDYLSNAPTGKIFAGAAKELTPIYLGPKHTALWETVYEPAMQSAEQGKATSAEAWAKANAGGKKLAEG